MKAVHLAIALCLSLTGFAASASAEPTEKFERKSRNEWVYEAKDGRREIKRERKPDGYKEEVKRGTSERKYEAKADGSWKEEIRRDNCVIKRERGSSGDYKEEHSC